MHPGTTRDLDQAATLAAVERSVEARRRVAVDELLLVLQWADLHADDPQDRPGAVPVRQGGDRLIQLGGDGTPRAGELCWAELAVARRAGVLATRNLAADALDLRHRLPLLFAEVLALQVEVWLARKVATMTRALSQDAAAMVDRALAAADDLAPGRLLALAEAKVIEADVEAHRRRIAQDAAATGVWLSRHRAGEEGDAGIRRIAARLKGGQALEVEAFVEDLSVVLGAHRDYQDLAPDQLRAEAFALMAHPDKVLALLHEAPGESLPRRRATLVLHLAPGSDIARSADLGPLLLDQVRDLLRHRNVRLQPVIDLNAVHTVDGYEHPARVKQRTLLRTGGDVFPHSASSGRRLDHDHVTPYDPLGPPGQTGDLNDAPLGRLHHRVKTHASGWQAKQLGLGAYRWVTPHGLARVVTPRGTRVVEPIRSPDGAVVGEIYDHPVTLPDLAVVPGR